MLRPYMFLYWRIESGFKTCTDKNLRYYMQYMNEKNRDMEILIEKYINELNDLRTRKDFSKYNVKIELNQDVNQINRYRIGVGLFNNLNTESDYQIVKHLFSEQIACMKSNSINFDNEILYMYFYFISEFKNIEDIWDYAELKFSGGMDSDIGFDTEFFLVYGKEDLRNYLKASTHTLKDKIYSIIFENELSYDDTSAEEYKNNKISFFGFKKPITNNLHFCQTLDEKNSFLNELKKWKNEIDLTIFRNAYDYVNYSKYTGDNIQICEALTKFIKNHPDTWITKDFINEKSKYCM
jgi:hypothetical protein